ncbi:MAG: Flp pilus assembly complex ATPase component TadA [Nitrospinaceae bacterium]|nr:Flp pilus assembly complex ATPase component TadA [Nitrospinaceae bacterium]
MADKAKTPKLLSNVDIFSSLSESELKKIVEIAEIDTHEPEKIVFRQGDPSDSFRVVQSGKFEIYLWDSLLKIERPIAILQPGDIFGEMGLLTGDPRSAFVRSKTKGETIRIQKEPFIKIMNDYPKICLALAQTLVHRLNSANKARRIPYENLASFNPETKIIKLLPLQVILRHQTVVLKKEKETVTVGMVNPSDLVARNTVAEFLGKYELEWVCISQPDFEIFRDKKLRELATEAATATDEDVKEIQYETTQPMESEAASSTALMMDEFVARAIDAAASDLHLEPGPAGVAIRARIDGRLVELAPNITIEDYTPLVSRFKVLADLDITEKRMPQDGSVRARYGKRQIDMRLSTLPTPRGESVVCRLLDPHQQKLDLKTLIVEENIADMVYEMFMEPSGLMLVTSPTGAGKTTTLYAGIHNRMERFPTSKLVTAEDPIEYEFGGATQVQVNDVVGLNYATILRSLLRQDPDSVLVGEMRDKASMEIAMEASLTGHFVMSSLHTNNVFETVTRLKQRGMEPYLIASALKGVISQRLVARLCSACSCKATPSDEIIEKLINRGIVEQDETVEYWRAPGCSHCLMSGRKGRLGLYEILKMTPTLSLAIEKGASMYEMKSKVSPESYLPMRRYARFLLVEGIADPEDLIEVFPSTTDKR